MTEFPRRWSTAPTIQSTRFTITDCNVKTSYLTCLYLRDGLDCLCLKQANAMRTNNRNIPITVLITATKNPDCCSSLVSFEDSARASKQNKAKSIVKDLFQKSYI